MCINRPALKAGAQLRCYDGNLYTVQSAQYTGRSLVGDRYEITLIDPDNEIWVLPAIYSDYTGRLLVPKDWQSLETWWYDNRYVSYYTGNDCIRIEGYPALPPGVD